MAFNAGKWEIICKFAKSIFDFPPVCDTLCIVGIGWHFVVRAEVQPNGFCESGDPPLFLLYGVLLYGVSSCSTRSISSRKITAG
jgi:hypothetical protein